MNAHASFEMSKDSKLHSKHSNPSKTRSQSGDEGTKPVQRPIDLGYDLILSVLNEKEFESVQIWDALGASCVDNPFEKFGAAFSIQTGPSWRIRTLEKSFPPLDEALSMVDTAFHVCFRFHETIDREEFLQAIRTLYNTTYEQDGFPYLDYFALLAATLALAYAMDANRHENIGCDNAMNNSLYYMMVAKANLPVKERNPTSVTQLRTVIMMMLFHLNANNIRFAFKLLPFACDSVSRLRLRDQTSMQTLYWTMLYLDSHICSLVNEPSFLDVSGAKSSMLAVIQHAASNQNRMVRSSQELLLDVGLALALELVDMRTRIAHLQLDDAGGKKARSMPTSDIRRLEQELDDLKAVCDSVFPSGEIVAVVARTRYELLMAHCITSLMLEMRRKWLISQARIASIPWSDSAERRSPVTAAILAIDHTTDYVKLPEHAPTTEPSAYALFVNILFLTQEMPITVDHDERKRFATKILEGFFLMSRMTCQAFAAPPIYLRYIYELGTRCGAIPPISETVSSFVRHGHQQNKFHVDWSFLPDYQDFSKDLLSIPDLHNTSSSQLTLMSTDTPFNRASPVASQQQSNFTRLSSTPSSSHISSGSSVPPSVFSQWSFERPETTPLSSTMGTPTKD